MKPAWGTSRRWRTPSRRTGRGAARSRPGRWASCSASAPWSRTGRARRSTARPCTGRSRRRTLGDKHHVMAGARGRLTLGQFFLVSLVALALLLAGLLIVITRGSQETIVLAAGRVMERASQRFTGQISDHLREAEQVVASFEARLAAGLVQADDPTDLMRALVGEVAPHPDVAEISFT